MGLSNSTASHAEPLEPGKGSNRIVRRREHGRTGAHRSAAYPQKSRDATLRSAPGGTQRSGPHTETWGSRQGKIRGRTLLENRAALLENRDRRSNKLVDGLPVPRPTRRPIRRRRLASIGSFETKNAIRGEIVKLTGLGPIGRAHLNNLWSEVVRRS